MKQISTPISIGRNIEKIRKLRDITQGDLALKLGLTRQAVSKIEQSESIDDEKLELIAQILGVSADGIKNFSETGTINYVQNNYDGSNKESHNVALHNVDCSFNLHSKFIEQGEEIKKLYEQLLKSEREKVEILQKLLDQK